jgi:hypothetical protein
MSWEAWGVWLLLGGTQLVLGLYIKDVSVLAASAAFISSGMSFISGAIRYFN